MSYTPEQNQQAISQGFTGYEDYLNNNPQQAQGGGGGGGGSWNGGQVFNAAKSALQQRYDSLIQGIKSNTGQQINRQTVTTNNELGKRGLLPSSGLAQQEMTNALNPINEAANAQMASASAQNNSDLANLALQQYSGQQTSQQNAIQNAISQGNLANQTAKTQYDINAPYYKPDSGNGDSLDLPGGAATGGVKWLNAQGQAWSDPTGKGKVPVTKLSNGQTLYSDGSKGWTQWTQQQA